MPEPLRGNRPRRPHRVNAGCLRVVGHLPVRVGTVVHRGVEFESGACRGQGPRIRARRHRLGGTVTLSGSKGAGTVDVSPSTHVTQILPSQLTNLAVGDCVVVHPTKDGGAPPAVTAASVQFAVAKDGRCGHGGGQGGKAVIGTVASITGNTVAVTDAAQPTVTVTVTPDTRYTSRNTATPAAIAVGQCLTARGTAGATGDVQAAAVSVRPSDDGQCQGKRGG